MFSLTARTVHSSIHVCACWYYFAGLCTQHCISDEECLNNYNITHFISSLVFTHAHLFLFSCTIVHHQWFIFYLYLSPQHCNWLFLTGTLTLPYPLVGLYCTIVTLFLLSVVRVCQDQCDFSHEHLQTKKKQLALRAHPYRIIFLHHCLQFTTFTLFVTKGVHLNAFWLASNTPFL